MKLALMQSMPRHDTPDNLDRLERIAGDASFSDARLLITPEMYLTGYAIGAEAARAQAMADDDPALARVAEIARAKNIAILTGYPEKNGDNKPFNAARLFDPDGSVLAHYRKSHLWPEVDDAQFTPGETLSPVVEYEGWKLGIAICYDIEFPEYSRALALAGAEILLIPTACRKPFEAVTTRTVPTRAEENGIYVTYCNYCGFEGETEYFGLSTVAAPDGQAIATATAAEAPLYATLERAPLDTARAQLGYIANRRAELYGSLVKAT